MTDKGLDERYRAACAIAHEAGELIRALFQRREAGAFELKGAQDYLTEADGEVERLVAKRIVEAFPGDTVVGEEGGGRLSSQLWLVDPIDGTANFARGIPHFCVSIAFLRDGRTALGAICNPMLNELYAARRGGGATLNGAPMHVSATDDMRRATVELGWSTRRPLSTYVAMVDRVTKTGAGFQRAGSGALGIAYVAAGRLDGYAELHINAWDAAAGLLMVEEADGRINDFLGHDGVAKGNPVLAATPALYDALAAATGIAR
jgi:myo-inositol-1(or 4)-monophosphatase